jgi:hypothetical protein
MIGVKQWKKTRMLCSLFLPEIREFAATLPQVASSAETQKPRRHRVDRVIALSTSFT